MEVRDYDASKKWPANPLKNDFFSSISLIYNARPASNIPRGYRFPSLITSEIIKMRYVAFR